MGEESIDHLHDPEEADEALSLCDLPLHSNTDDNNIDFSNKQISSLADPPECFEFLADLSSENMCSADDIIFCGKLVPFKHQTVPSSTHQNKEDKKQIALRRRSESLSELQSSNKMISRSSSTKLMRNSRSLNSRKLHRLSSSSNTSPESDIERNPSLKSVGKTDSISAKKATVKPRWYVFMFGMVKFPPEMELKDIKSRQFRRNPSVMFPPLDPGRISPVNRSSAGGKGSWKFLKALSCKDHASVAVTASFCIPQS